MVVERFNKDAMMSYIVELVKRLKNQYCKEKSVIVVDNHSVHISCIEELSKYFKVLRLPTYSCEFNSIETIWGLAKQRLKKIMLMQTEEVSKTYFNDLVRQALAIDKSVVGSVIKSNRSHIL